MRSVVRGLSDQQEEFRVLKKQFQALRNEVKQEKLKNKKLSKTIKKVELQNAELQTKLEETEIKFGELQKYFTTNTVVTKYQPKSSVTFPNNGTKRLPYMIQKYNHSSKYKRQQRSPFKFPRMLVGPDRVNVRADQTLRFIRTDVNIGECYHSSTGVFSCNTAGIYVFFYNLMCNIDNYISTSLVKNGKQLNQCVCDGQSARYIPCSIATIVNYNIGDSIWVRVEASDPPTSSSFGSENSFSGFLLYQDNN
ncbi:hypothetical protein KUTeg_015615 [Tegillarca granosa]|uniref:C1q domain-containing protein n=1 Tax=Tegillarca granosa TaxID=220873 RepID=A0ABQ9ET33_TEGGR|nr:hypothetical protein KUTeg_015615 [Tegillarca granosa]